MKRLLTILAVVIAVQMIFCIGCTSGGKALKLTLLASDQAEASQNTYPEATKYFKCDDRVENDKAIKTISYTINGVENEFSYVMSRNINGKGLIDIYDTKDETKSIGLCSGTQILYFIFDDDYSINPPMEAVEMNTEDYIEKARNFVSAYRSIDRYDVNAHENNNTLSVYFTKSFEGIRIAEIVVMLDTYSGKIIAVHGLSDYFDFSEEDVKYFTQRENFTDENIKAAIMKNAADGFRKKDVGVTDMEFEKRYLYKNADGKTVVVIDAVIITDHSWPDGSADTWLFSYEIE